MNFEDRQLIGSSREELWDYLMQIEKVGECIPGCDSVRKVEGDSYETTMRMSVGPIKLRFEALLHVVERDRANWVATMKADGAERGVGGTVHAVFTMTLIDRGQEETELVINTEAKILGKLGEFGQPVMKKKAATIMQHFARALGERLETQRAAPASAA